MSAVTENEKRAAVVEQALGWLGLGEHDGSHAEILRVYNAIRPLPRGYTMGPGDPWCAAFVSAVGAVCGLGELLFPECGCAPMLARYRAAGRFLRPAAASPRPGDLIFYDWNGDGEPDHVGIVAELEDGRLSVVEGNYADRVGLRHVSPTAACVLGYAVPDYAAGESPAPAEGAEAEAAAEETCEAALLLPYLRRGARGETVRAAQLLLIGRGYRCGPCGADGDFGPATYGSVFSFQRGRRLEADGVIGPITWRALIGGWEGAGACASRSRASSPPRRC